MMMRKQKVWFLPLSWMTMAIFPSRAIEHGGTDLAVLIKIANPFCFLGKIKYCTQV
jgi:hypothetical protein